MVGLEVGADPDVVAAMMIAAIDQHIADAGGTHLAEGNLLRVVGSHGRIIKNPALPHEFRRMAKELVGTIAAVSRMDGGSASAYPRAARDPGFREPPPRPGWGPFLSSQTAEPERSRAIGVVCLAARFSRPRCRRDPGHGMRWGPFPLISWRVAEMSLARRRPNLCEVHAGAPIFRTIGTMARSSSSKTERSIMKKLPVITLAMFVQANDKTIVTNDGKPLADVCDEKTAQDLAERLNE